MSTYPYVTGDPILRTCRHCHSRVAAPAMCVEHPRTCMTCCVSRLNRQCSIGPWEVPTEKYFPDMTWEERQADIAKLNRELGFREATEAELAEDEKWRTSAWRTR